jgi:hypothetical protein
MHGYAYLKVILTVIAIELAWLGVKDLAPRVSAQATATPVVITGVQIAGNEGGFVPVAIVGAYRDAPRGPHLLGPLATRIEGRVPVQLPLPVKVAADMPLPVQQVDYTPRARPGE